MMMCRIIGEPADQIPARIITGGCMLMDMKTLCRTVRHLLLIRGYLGIAGFRVRMLLKLALLLFQSDRRKDQRINRAEHHHTGQARHNLVPAFPSLMCLSIFLCALQSILLHIPITILPISMLQSQAGARPGIQFFQQSVLQRRSQLWCCANPPK